MDKQKSKTKISSQRQEFRDSDDVIKLGDLFDELCVIDISTNRDDAVHKILEIEPLYKKIMLKMLSLTQDEDNLKDLNEIRHFYDEALFRLITIRNDFKDSIEVLKTKKQILSDHKEVASLATQSSNLIETKEKEFEFCIQNYDFIKNIIQKLYDINAYYKDTSKEEIKHNVMSIINEFYNFSKELVNQDSFYKDNIIYKAIYDFLGKTFLELSSVLVRECNELSDQKKLDKKFLLQNKEIFTIIESFIKENKEEFSKEYQKAFSKIKFSFLMLDPKTTLIIFFITLSPVVLITIISLLLYSNNI